MQSIDPSRGLATPHPEPEWFSGPVHVQALGDEHADPDLEILAVFFDAGARTKPHTHTTDQLLYFLEDHGVVATRTGGRRFGRGGMALIPAHEWHWHGAAPEGATAHLSIRPVGPSSWPPEVPLEDWDRYMDRIDPG